MLPAFDFSTFLVHFAEKECLWKVIEIFLLVGVAL